MLADSMGIESDMPVLVDVTFRTGKEQHDATSNRTNSETDHHLQRTRGSLADWQTAAHSACFLVLLSLPWLQLTRFVRLVATRLRSAERSTRLAVCYTHRRSNNGSPPPPSPPTQSSVVVVISSIYLCLFNTFPSSFVVVAAGPYGWHSRRMSHDLVCILLR
ncbi:hypothetical protein VTN77DRAFT_9263 [Rasamsonia byssochlamydoides]|uniref:uncharacterized protein n=1 Tax=Rasamsonia byssochlamydoides TaxID=89139 RepID=UPI0037435CAC